MNALEIDDAVSALAEQETFDPTEFPFAFLKAFGSNETTLKRLRKGETNRSDTEGVLRTGHIHIKVAPAGEVDQVLAALRASPATSRAKAKFILATDGEDLRAEDLVSGETVACSYRDLPNHLGFFLPLAGFTTVPQIRESAFDIRATSRLNKLYVELRKQNPEWDSEERRPDMNHFMARLIFCFFAEDTSIFPRDPTGPLFTVTVDRMSERDASNTHEVIEALFLAMNTKAAERDAAGIPRWAERFPYVNGGLFSGTLEVPRFSKIARSYLLHIGGLDWTKINPDIFGSMIQAVADEEERGGLGLHYTSVPNILKVLNPLFLDDLRAKLEDSGKNSRVLLNLRRRIAHIRVFDPACGSGNFLVIAYKEMRAIEAEINRCRGESGRRSDIPLTNFRGIELRDFAAEIARLALIIAEYQCDVLYRGQQLALAEFLPLEATNWITCGNALRLDWLSVCPPSGAEVTHQAEDFFESATTITEVDFENEGGETYICGNPPYKGTKNQTRDEKNDLKQAFLPYTARSGTLDYVAGWFLKASEYSSRSKADVAFVATNSICQGGQVPVLWPILYGLGVDIRFAYHSFSWRNLATHNAVVTVIIVGLSAETSRPRRIFQVGKDDRQVEIAADHIGPYLIPGHKTIVVGQTGPISEIAPMQLGNAPYDGGNLILERSAVGELGLAADERKRWLRDLWGSSEIIDGHCRQCIWIESEDLEDALRVPSIRERIDKVRQMRNSSSDAGTRAMADRAHQFREMNFGRICTVGVPIRSSEFRPYLPVDILGPNCCITNLAYAIYDGPLMNVAVIASRLHLVWIGSVCGRMKTDFSYSNKMGWHTFPVPTLTDKNKADLTRTAEDILLTREAHFPATIADLYDPEKMPADLREAHERNDEVLERIYIGRRFRNDTERLEKLFELYTKMVAVKDKTGAAGKISRGKGGRRKTNKAGEQGETLL